MEDNWYLITHKETGDQQHVASLEGIDKDEWVVIPFEREPSEFDSIYIKHGKACVQEDFEAKKQARKRGRRGRITIPTIIERLLKAEQRITQLEQELTELKNKDSLS